MKEYMTAVRRTLLDYFEHNCDRRLTIDDMQRELAASGISRSAIYRNVDRMVADGLLRRTAEGRRSAYQYIASEHCCDHIHIQCTRCGVISHIEANEERALRAAFADSSFKLDEHKTVLYGVCRKCC